MKFRLVYIVCKDRLEAEKIGRQLVENRLAACVNLNPIESMYWWEGKIEQSSEITLIAKTTKKNVEKIKKTVKELHSYSCPCIISLKIDKGEKEYLKWISNETK